MNIGWIGTGVMGISMAQHLADNGHSLRVYNRTRSKAEPLIKNGAVWAESPAEAALDADIVFTIVGFPNDVEQVILGKNGVLETASKGSILVDMTTSTPALAERIHRESAKKGVQSIDAPVSGGDIGAKEGTLAIMVGAEQEAFDRVEPLFSVMGKNIRLMGGPGKGQHTKMCNQILIAGTMIGVVESLLYAWKAGMDQQQVIEVIGKGAAGSWSINQLGPQIAEKNYDPGFFIKHFVKDMRIALDEAHRMQLALPGLALAEQFYTAAMSLGYEELGTQGLYKVFEKMNGAG
ncbi:MAG: NAD(P)-dependent oxidoreductase [Balneolaceae bacterium]